MKRVILLALGIFLFSGSLSQAENYYDNFDGLGNITWQVRTGLFSIENERYLAESETSSSNRDALATADLLFSEGTIQTKFQTKPTGGMYHNAFIVFGYQDDSNFYTIGARDGDNKWTLERMLGGGRKRLLQVPEDISSGLDYVIKAVLQNGQVRLYVNEVEKLSYSFTDIPTGNVGLALINAVTYFDDVEISTSVPPEEIPRYIRFQARLGDAQEASLDGIFTLTFKLYDTAVGGTPLWEELQQDVVAEEGCIDVKLGGITSLDLPFDQQYWLGVEVEADGEMVPRFEFTTVPYSFKSITTEQ